MNRSTFRLTAVSALPAQRLRLRFADGLQTEADLSGWIRGSACLAPLANPDLFIRARLDQNGCAVVWIDDELELAADNLRNLCIEQAGGIGHERIWNWLARNHLTQQQTADAIGISRRMLNYYLSGSKPIPKTVWLACVGYEAEQAHAA